MFRKAFCLGLIGLVLSCSPAVADTGSRSPAPPSKARSGTKRVVWTLVGVGAGFGAGLLIGLHAFDDSINSDQKVWTSAIVGAAAGGLAGGLLSRNVGRVPAARPAGVVGPGAPLRLAPWSPAGLPSLPEDEMLRRRVRQLTLRQSSGATPSPTPAQARAQ